MAQSQRLRETLESIYRKTTPPTENSSSDGTFLIRENLEKPQSKTLKVPKEQTQTRTEPQTWRSTAVSRHRGGRATPDGRVWKRCARLAPRAH